MAAVSRIEERADVPFVLEIAHVTIDAHDAGRGCQSCTADGCDIPCGTWLRSRLRAASVPKTIRK